jgi:hypothetical protein
MFGLNVNPMSGDKSAAERRGADRFPLERDIRYKIVSKRLGHEQGSGKTINMSSSGLLFSTDGTLLPGKKVEVAVSWPAQLENRCALKLMARGRVVRTEKGRAAVEIQQYEFRTMGTAGLNL